MRAQARLVLRSVEVDHGAVDKRLLGGIEPDDRFAQFGIDVLDGLEHAFAEIAARIAVAQFNGLARSGGRARGHGGASGHARLEHDVGFDGGVAARIENLAGDHVNNGAHGGYRPVLKFVVANNPVRDLFRNGNHGLNNTMCLITMSCPVPEIRPP